MAISRKWTIAIVATLAVAALALVLSGEALGSITGVQPPASGDWVIDQDTTVLAETFTLNGNIYVEPGYKLTVRNSFITIASTYMGEFGFYVMENSTHDGEIDLSQATFQSKDPDYGWYFELSGKVYIHDSVTLKGIQDGIIIFSDDVTITETDAHVVGMYGIVVVACSPTLGDDLEVWVDYQTSAWDGSSRSEPSPGYALVVTGGPGAMGSPNIDGVRINYKMMDDWEGSTSSSSVYEYFYVYGIYSDYGELDSITNLYISLDCDVKANITTSYSYIYFRTYWYIYPVYLTGSTYLGDFDNVSVSDSSYHVDVYQSGASSSYLYNYLYFYGIYNNIGSSGSVPSSWAGPQLRGHMNSWETHGTFSSVYDNPNGYGIYWYPSTSASSADQTLKNIVLDGVKVQRPLYWQEKGATTLVDCEVSNSKITSYFFYLYSWNYAFTLDGCVIYNNTIGSYFMYNYYWDGGLLTVKDTTISMNTFSSYFIYDYQTSSSYDGDYLFQDNWIEGNKFSSYFIYHYYGYGEWDWDGNTFLNNSFGSYAFYLYYYNRADWTFTNNNFTGNSATYMFYYYYYHYADLIFENNIIAKNSVSYMWYHYYTNDGDFILKNNVIEGNTHSGYGVYYYGYYNYNNDVLFEDNIWSNNSYSSYGFYVYYTRYNFIFSGNTLERNRYSSSYLMYNYQYYLTGKFEFTDNIIDTNTISTYGFMLYYIGYATDDITFSGNSIINNTGNTAYEYYGIVMPYYLAGDLEVVDNYIAYNKATGICFYYLYGYYTHYSLYIERNEIVGNIGKGILVYNAYYGPDVYFRYNYGTGNQDYAIAMDASSYSYHGPTYLSVESNEFEDNPGGGIYMRPYFFDPQYGYNYRQVGQTVSIKKNLLRNNGAGGWALAVVDFARMPTMKNNDLTGSAMGQYLELTADKANREEYNLVYREEEWDGGVNGTTALGFGEINVEFYDCTFINYTEAVFAKDCLINVWFSRIPSGSGRTEGAGRIYVWNWLEIWVNWANATGVDSGVPASNCTVALRGANDKYFGGLMADEEGKLKPMLINPWTSKGGKMDAWSPFEVTILGNGISTSTKLDVYGDMLDPNAQVLLLVDDRPPEPTVAFPQEGMFVNSKDVTTEGFLFEVGSGIKLFEGRSDMAGAEWETIEPDVIWEHMFMGMSEGAHTFTVRAADRSGNWNVTNLSVIVDITTPDLDLTMRYLTGDAIDLVGGRYFVNVREILITGTYEDNIVGLGDIRIRVNGVYEYIFPSNWGNISKRMRLVEGFNSIIIDATDLAGNMRTAELEITRDTFSPLLYIYTPIQGSATSEKMAMLTGKSEPNVDISVSVQYQTQVHNYTTRTGADGTFSIVIELIENPTTLAANAVIVRATDSAENYNETRRDVTLDTVPPEYQIVTPPQMEIITKELTYVVQITLGSYDYQSRVWIGGQEVTGPDKKRTIVLQEGDNLIEILAVDSVGHETLEVVNIIRDTIAPEMTVLNPDSDYILTNNNLIYFSGTVRGASSPIIVMNERTQIKKSAELLGQGSWADGADWECTFELGPNDLQQNMIVSARDAAGNEVTWTVSVTYDVIPPSLQLEQLPQTTDSAILVVNGSTDTNIPNVFVQGVSFPVTDGFFSLAWPLTEGQNVLLVEIKEPSGNVASSTIVITYIPKEVEQIEGPTTGDEGTDWTGLMGWVVLVAAITLIATAVIVSSRNPRRG